MPFSCRVARQMARRSPGPAGLAEPPGDRVREPGNGRAHARISRPTSNAHTLRAGTRSKPGRWRRRVPTDGHRSPPWMVTGHPPPAKIAGRVQVVTVARETRDSWEPSGARVSRARLSKWVPPLAAARFRTPGGPLAQQAQRGRRRRVSGGRCWCRRGARCGSGGWAGDGYPVDGRDAAGVAGGGPGC